MQRLALRRFHRPGSYYDDDEHRAELVERDGLRLGADGDAAAPGTLSLTNSERFALGQEVAVVISSKG